jgi:hypothetical protein
MKKPDNLKNLVGARITTQEDREGVIFCIGYMSEDPWVEFPDNNHSVRVSWESIKKLELENNELTEIS